MSENLTIVITKRGTRCILRKFVMEEWLAEMVADKQRPLLQNSLMYIVYKCTTKESIEYRGLFLNIMLLHNLTTYYI